MAVALSQEEQDRLLRFAEKGGKVIVEAAAGFYDEHGEMNVQSSLLKKAFYASNFSISYQGNEEITDGRGNLVCENAPYVQTMDIRNGNVLGTVKNGKTVYAENTYGKGSIRWIGTLPAMMAKREECHLSRTFVKNVFLQQGFDILKELKAEGLIVRMLELEGEYHLAAVNQHPDERKIMLEAYGKVLKAVVPGYDGILIQITQNEMA